MYRKIPTQRPPPSKRPPPFSAPKVLQRGHISSCNRPERLFLGTCRLTLYEKCSVMVTFLFHQLSCQMSSRAIAHPLVSGALNVKRPWAIGRDFTVLENQCCHFTIKCSPRGYISHWLDVLENQCCHFTIKCSPHGSISHWLDILESQCCHFTIKCSPRGSISHWLDVLESQCCHFTIKCSPHGYISHWLDVLESQCCHFTSPVLFCHSLFCRQAQRVVCSAKESVDQFAEDQVVETQVNGVFGF